MKIRKLYYSKTFIIVYWINALNLSVKVKSLLRENGTKLDGGGIEFKTFDKVLIRLQNSQRLNP
jgi:hypothetical protein